MARLKVTVERIDGYCNQPMLVGDSFIVDGGKIRIENGEYVCMWALQSMMPVFPILAARDRLGKDHWVTKIDRFSCPDPKGLVQYRLELED